MIIRKIYLIVGIFAIISLALVVLVILPLAGNIRKNSQDLIVKESEISVIEQKKKNLDSLRSDYEFRQRDLDRIDAFFVDFTTPIDFTRFLEKTAADSYVDIKISLSNEKISIENSISFNISLKGSFSNFSKFLEKLENGPYPIEVLKLNIKRGGEGEISSTLIILVLGK